MFHVAFGLMERGGTWGGGHVEMTGVSAVEEKGPDAEPLGKAVLPPRINLKLLSCRRSVTGSVTQALMPVPQVAAGSAGSPESSAV